MKSIMLYNHGGCGNRGCEAIVRSTSALFAQHARLSLTSLTADEDRQVGLQNLDRIDGAKISPFSLQRIPSVSGWGCPEKVKLLVFIRR